jgi:hypothetical protein
MTYKDFVATITHSAGTVRVRASGHNADSPGGEFMSLRIGDNCGEYSILFSVAEGRAIAAAIASAADFAASVEATAADLGMEAA